MAAASRRQRLPEGPLVAGRDAPVGGQAVLEGVMMRGVSTWAVAVRAPAPEQIAGGRHLELGEAARGEIVVQSFPLVSVRKRHRWLRWPVVRGVVALGESLQIGFKALGISANAQTPEDEEPISSGTWMGTVAIALTMAIGLFFLLPVGLTSLVKDSLPNSLVFVLVEKLVRISIFLLYLWAVSRLKDLQRVFEYHGAEHKTISCYEAGLCADAIQRPALQPPAPALRHELHADRHGRRGLRLRAARHARLVLAVRLADRRHPARRGARVRGHQVDGAQPHQALGAGADGARDEAAAADDARARPRPAGGRDQPRWRRCWRSRRRPTRPTRTASAWRSWRSWARQPCGGGVAPSVAPRATRSS